MAGKQNTREFPWLAQKDIAHRGLFVPGTLAEENTVASAMAAVEAGYGIEIDVRTTADDIVVVFHDDTLERMTDGQGAVGLWGFQQIRKYIVGASGRPIPSLPDVLEAVNGQAPIYVEIKSHRKMDIQKLCAGVRHCFEGYHGPVAIMSFDPRIVAWFRTYMPKYARGLIVGREMLLKMRNRLSLVWWTHKCRPDFIACDVNLLPNSFAMRWRAGGKPVLTWTVRSEQMAKIAREHADALIFESPAVVGPR
ncbi:MAG: glycerophosphodiester phosphodiesterase [Alphaproteobacteria bacterium]|nr:MAG: glycerophosphodiester phosphodiesterase [Alphaproteobacteria bacterium]